MYCWHRPGPLSPTGSFRTCRHCRVAIQVCECDTCYRKPDPTCEVCGGSGWRAIVRGQAATFAAYVADRL